MRPTSLVPVACGCAGSRRTSGSATAAAIRPAPSPHPTPDENRSAADVPDHARYPAPSPKATTINIGMYGSRGILNRSVSTHVTRNAATAMMAKAARASCQLKLGSATAMTDASDLPKGVLDVQMWCANPRANPRTQPQRLPGASAFPHRSHCCQIEEGAEGPKGLGLQGRLSPLHHQNRKRLGASAQRH